MKKLKCFICLIITLFAVGLSPGVAEAAQKQTIFNSPFVRFSPDGKAWTTNGGDADCQWYDNGTTVSTGIPSSLRGLETGEHYYEKERLGQVPIGYWEVAHRPAQCIHDDYPADEEYHGIDYGRSKCGDYYYSGWMAYCADCGGRVRDMFTYMSEAAAQTIDYMELSMGDGTFWEYYYLCPHCANLEMGAKMTPHMCKAISWNRYEVEYDENCAGIYGGYMQNSVHMYNNATEYNGEPVTPATRLTKNAYTRIGYEFTGWNTKPDGSGASYQDEQEIFNLTTEDRSEFEKGIVTLYAQWRPSASALVLDAQGGAYNGQSVFTVAKNYLQSYQIDNGLLKAPSGCTVAFETNGGGAIAPITGTRHFTEWSMAQPFRGDFYQGIYTFTAPDGNTDTLKARYALDAVTLPAAAKPGSSFGGWYYDGALTQPAGGAGDKLTPTKDLTLYAQWVDLTLSAKDNYGANGGAGAVDLSWTQSDGNHKTYLIYQSRDNANWAKINDANDIGSGHAVQEAYGFTGDSGRYTVPYTGMYTLTAEGAQGGGYGGFQGGYGGKAAVNVWLTKGEVLTYTVGGRNGYHGGGSASAYGNGGGMTSVSSDKKGVLLIAGGGGGASPSGNGGAGGSAASVVAGNAGQPGMAGGGAGANGGTAGENVVHYHTEACYRDTSKDIVALKNENAIYYEVKEETITAQEKFNPKKIVQYYGSRERPIPTEGGASLKLEASQTHRWGDSGQYICTDINGIKIFNQNGELLFEKTLEDLVRYMRGEYARATVGSALTPNYANHESSFSAYNDVDNDMEYNGVDHTWLHYGPDGAVSSYTTFHKDPNMRYNDAYPHQIGKLYPEYNAGAYFLPEILSEGMNAWWGSHKYILRYEIPIPAGTTGIYMEYTACSVPSHGLPSLQDSPVTMAYLSAGRQLVCGYGDGQVISAKPAYGGSNYCSPGHAYASESHAGVRAGDGAFSIASRQIGFVDGLKMDGVAARDMAAPDAIEANAITKEAVSADRISVSWRQPRDNGTAYYHVAESYLIGSGSPLCRSNVTKNTLTSGIRGYYCLLNESPSSNVAANNGSFQTGSGMEVPVAARARYLHIAPVDAAGNVGGSVHVKINGKEEDEGDVAWKLYTRRLSIEAGDNVHAADAEKTWYVRADGETPFTLRHDAYMDGAATAGYQPNYTIFETEADGETARNVIRTPSREITEETIRTEAQGLRYSTEGKPLLRQFPYLYTIRSRRNSRLEGVQKFTLDKEASGRRLRVIPVTGADREGGVVYSEAALDRDNGITLIGDGEPPEITGLELLENKGLIDRNEGSVALNAMAEDALSGVRDFYVTVYNTDNAIEKTFRPDKQGRIQLDITRDEPVYSGDFIVTACAVDRVGNSTEQSYATTEFALKTEVKRILEPHDPVFKRGESGILTIATWGYAERVEVEFPAELAKLNPELNTTCSYKDAPCYKQEENLQFMIPLYAPVNQKYTITVRAYKGDKKLEDYPALSTIEVEGSILGDFRTRLR